jgi:hypothetical protein
VKLTRRALAGIAAGALAPEVKATPKPLTFPVTRHAGNCPTGDMCGECYDLMDEYDEAIGPVVDRALEAFWKSVNKDMPFFKRDDSYQDDLQEAARTTISNDSFDAWQATPEAAKIRASLPPPEDEDD